MNFTASVTNDSANARVTWSLSGTSCSGSACGTLSGSSTTAVTYTAPATVSSPLTVSVKATSAKDSAVSASTSVVVNPPPAVTTTSLSGGTVGTAYSETLTGSGGSGNLSWSVSSGSLPGGLTLNASKGVISGTPTSSRLRLRRKVAYMCTSFG